MPTPRKSKATPVASVEVIEPAEASVTALPSGSARAARRRADRNAVGAVADLETALRMQIEDLSGQLRQVVRDRNIAQQAAESTAALLEGARAQLTNAYSVNEQLAQQLGAATVELDGLYDAHPELVDEPVTTGS